MPKVSVVIPIYNVENYIERCSRRLFEQTLCDMEFIFVDDCSPDNSIKILEEIIEDYPDRKGQIRIVHHSENKGLPQARKTGVLIASGDYLAHCDSDDWPDIDLYERMYNKAEESKADIVVCDYKESDGINDLNIISGGDIENPLLFLKKMLVRDIPWTMWNKLFKRVIFTDILFPVGNMGEDMALTVQLVLNSKKISHVSDTYYNYFYNTSSIMKAYDLDKNMKNYKDMRGNVKIVEDALNTRMMSTQYQSGIIYIRFNSLVKLFPYTNYSNYYHLLKNTYPNMFFKFLFSPYIKLGLKLRYILSYIKIYPLIWGIAKRSL